MIRKWFDALTNLLFGRLDAEQDRPQESRYTERFIARGSVCRSDIVFMDIRTEKGRSGLKGSARMTFFVAPSTPVRGEHAREERSN
jgi:hypothetical protein